jgi:tetratricopeptide (TPR) repeat protein
MKPDDLNTRLLRARLLIWMRRYDDAEEKIREVEQIDPDYPIIRYPKSLLYAAKGDGEKALELIQGESSYAFYYLISNVYAAMGMNKEALHYIQEGIKHGFEEVKTYLFTYQYLINDPFYTDLSKDPQFQEILLRAKEEYEERKSKYQDL